MNNNYKGLIEGYSGNPQTDKRVGQINKKAKQIYQSPTFVKLRNDYNKMGEDLKKNEQANNRILKEAKLFYKNK